MTSTCVPHTAVLRCHPQTYSRAVYAIEASVSCTRHGALALAYILKGDLSRLRIPPARTPSRGDRLWEHTCFEAFLSAKENSGYYEFNFAPSGEWAAYAFRGYRNRSSPPLVEGHSYEREGLTPGITVRSEGISLKVDGIIRLDHLTRIEAGARLRLGLSAVIEDDRGVLSYWALKHPPGKPDFHHPEAFALELEPLACPTPDGPSTNRP